MLVFFRSRGLRFRKPSGAGWAGWASPRRPAIDCLQTRRSPQSGRGYNTESAWTVGFIWAVSQLGYRRSGVERRPFSRENRGDACRNRCLCSILRHGKLDDADRPPRITSERREPKTLSDVPCPPHSPGASYLPSSPDSRRTHRGPQRILAIEAGATDWHRPPNLLCRRPP